MAWWLMPRTPDPEVGGSSPTRVKPCCVLEQGIFTPQKVLVIPRKRWLRPNMTEKLLSGTLRINQPTIDPIRCNGNKKDILDLLQLLRYLITKVKTTALKQTFSILFKHVVQNKTQIQFYKRTISKPIIVR